MQTVKQIYNKIHCMEAHGLYDMILNMQETICVYVQYI